MRKTKLSLEGIKKIQFPKDYWIDRKNQRNFFDKLEKELEIKTWEDWYKVHFREIKRNGGISLLNHYKGSHIKALSTIYPEHDWKVWKFSKVPNNFWTNVANQRDYMNALGIEVLKIDPSDPINWYSIHKQDLENYNGHSLLKLYKYSVTDILLTVYPEYNWEPWRFKSLGRGYWNSLESQQNFFDQLGLKLGISNSNWENWYGVDINEVIEFGGDGFLSLRNYSLVEALSSAYPQYPWDPNKFQNTVQKQRDFFLQLGKKLNISSIEDWYKVKRNDIRENGGLNILRLYGESHMKALMSLFPEYNLEPWKFEKVHQGFWEEDENLKLVLDYIAKKLSISQYEEWTQVSIQQLHSLGCSTLVNKYGGVLPLVKRFYSNEVNSLQSTQSQSFKTKSQNYLFKVLKSVFPSPTLDIHLNYPYQSSLSNTTIQLDIFIPDLKLAFEYQGTQHYRLHFQYGNPNITKSKDELKKLTCVQNGITLIEIPYWWDLSQESLQSTIHKYRPDLVKSNLISVPPIPESPPQR